MIKKPRASFDRKLILQDILRENDISIDDVAYICDEPDRVVARWFSGDGEPSRFCLMQLRHALYLAHRTIPSSLVKFVESQESRVKYWGKRFKTDAASADVRRDHKPIETYKFHGQKMKLSDIAKSRKCVVSVKTLRGRIKAAGILVGEDVSEIASIYTQQGKKIKTQA
ncbi:hypothetical protein [Agarilytica rhodophyticola]|uniref:hypothetical protein n=1 Tax=Agarilytica rhodophyticola TaxID=1737490 RepID=UPI000B345DBC|nr:hypothetical protein [Agarilytica rhodophyticola]